MTKRVCILGGTGFVGRHLIARLTSEGIFCTVPSRHPQRQRGLLTNQRIKLLKIDHHDQEQLQSCFMDCTAVINLIGILNEQGSQTFQHTHVELSDQVVTACKASGIPRLLHMSALHANEANGPSLYLKSKGEAENLAHAQAPPQLKVTSFRPSVIFGEDDSFFNRFAALLEQLPGPFPLACPEAKFAPVYVGDVVEAFFRTLDNQESWGKHYELCGPRVFSLRELVTYTANCIGKRKAIIGLNPMLSAWQARIMSRLPGKPFTHDNYLSMQVDNICSENGLKQLGIEATDVDTIVPFFLGGNSERQRYYQLINRDKSASEPD